MNRRLLIWFLCFYSIAFAQNTSQFCEQLTALDALIKKEHYLPKPLDDNLSKGVLELFIDRIDSEKNYLTLEDINTINDYKLDIDDFIKSNQCEFINTYTSLFEKRILSIKTILEDLKTAELDYSGKDSLHFIPKSKFNFFKTENDLKKYWSKRVRYRIITKLIDDDSLIDNVTANFKTLEQLAKPKVIQNQLCLLDEILNQNGGIDAFIKDTFLNAIVKYNDPNSTFFNSNEKKIYENSLSTDQMSFGIITKKDTNGNIVVAYITPGSAAFKNGKIEENDIIVSLTSGNDILETICINTDDILEFTNDENHKNMTFKIKKKNGTVLDVNLIKTKLKVQENAVKGFIIGENTTIGYFKVPSFYTNRESPNGLGLANDIAKELYRLQKEKINGLIIDLRFNGGGSMQEASDLSGMFIDRGPLAILKFPNGETSTIRDPKRGTFFNKPILILINNYSASASEFFAAAMQDYNRAILVGSTTHGKSSAQIILPLHETKNLGFTKLTVEAFYRVTGKSHQSKGVIPDIILPSFYDNFKSTEKFTKYALKNDSIEPRLLHKPLKKININSLASKSKLRIDRNEVFSIIKSSNEKLIYDYFNASKIYPLTLLNVHNDRTTYNDYWDTIIENRQKHASSISVVNTKSTDEILAFSDEETKDENSAIINDLSKDVFVQEGYHILLDYINEINTPN